jgi:hypothetical protein
LISVLFMSLSNLVNLSSLIDDAKCYELVRQHQWPEESNRNRGRLVARAGEGG